MPESWNDDVKGTQVPPLINSDADIIRCVAGPGSGKTFGLVRRVERILHPEGLAVDGHEVLRDVKSDPALKNIPIVIMTSSREEQDVVRTYAAGVNAYVVKPVMFPEFAEAVRQLGVFWTAINVPAPSANPR